LGNRQLIAAACPQARELGLIPGLPVTQARALVPDLDIRDSEPEADAALLESLALFAVRRWTPRAAVSPPDGLFLDLSGVAHLFGGEEAMCRRILLFCARAGFTARIAVAGTYGAAHALARFSRAPMTFCPNGAEADAVAPMPLAALRLGDDALGAARRLGLETVGELVAMPRAPLQRRFGKILVERLDQAIGRAPEAIDPVVPEEPLMAELRFAEPIAGADAIGEALARLMANLASTLAKSGLGARRILLSCLRVDNEEQRIAIGTARATRDRAHLLRLMLPKIEEIDPGFGIESMRLLAARAEPLAAEQPSLRAKRSNPAATALEAGLPRRCAPRNDESESDLSFLIDRLAARLGARRLFRIGAVESDVPERSARRVPPLARPPEWPRWPRPVRLLAPPERVENVVALLPDLPPRRFTWRGRAYRVEAADGPERIHGEWWRARREADAVRDYFQVEDEDGARFWLFRRGDGVDPRTGDLSWYLHGVFG
jgi:protein ImuB